MSENLNWYEHPLHRRAPAGGEEGVDGKFYAGGKFEPFYIPRAVMPQVDEADYPALLEHLDRHGVAVNQTAYCPKDLRAHQRVSREHVMNMPPQVLDKPLLTSLDRYVLDGNHRWWGHCLNGSKCNVLEIEAEFEDAMRLLFSFPKVFTLEQVGNQIRN